MRRLHSDRACPHSWPWYSTALVAAWRPADPQITRIELTRIESPTFGARHLAPLASTTRGRRAFGEVDPHDVQNVVIQDIGLAPRNSQGMVE
jgi:hypothetical protein